MKKIIFIFGTTILILGFLMCEKESTTNKIAYVKTQEGGCNGEDFSDLKSANEEQADTILFTIKNDTLDIYVGINYICCAPFTSSNRVTNDSIILTITDPCTESDASCYCWCMCYYTWDFLFVDYESKEYAFQVILIDPREEEPKVLWEGRVNLSLSN
jgi:hypothetical protein